MLLIILGRFNPLIIRRYIRVWFCNKISPVSAALLRKRDSRFRTTKKDCHPEVSLSFLRAVSEQQSEYLYAL